MAKSETTVNIIPSRFTGLLRRYREFSLIARDPVLFMSLLFSGIFITVFIVVPLFRTISGEIGRAHV